MSEMPSYLGKKVWTFMNAYVLHGHSYADSGNFEVLM
jgi:hypothetical protein